jgi:hypothetical protein
VSSAQTYSYAATAMQRQRQTKALPICDRKARRYEFSMATLDIVMHPGLHKKFW